MPSVKETVVNHLVKEYGGCVRVRNTYGTVIAFTSRHRRIGIRLLAKDDKLMCHLFGERYEDVDAYDIYYSDPQLYEKIAEILNDR